MNKKNVSFWLIFEKLTSISIFDSGNVTDKTVDDKKQIIEQMNDTNCFFSIKGSGEIYESEHPEAIMHWEPCRASQPSSYTLHKNTRET